MELYYECFSPKWVWIDSSSFRNHCKTLRVLSKTTWEWKLSWCWAFSFFKLFIILEKVSTENSGEWIAALSPIQVVSISESKSF